MESGGRIKRKSSKREKRIINDPLALARQRILESNLKRNFAEEQRRYLKELDTKRKDEIEKLRKEALNELEKLRNSVNIELSASNVRPPEGTYYVTDSAGKKLLITEEQRKELMEAPEKSKKKALKEIEKAMRIKEEAEAKVKKAEEDIEKTEKKALKAEKELKRKEFRDKENAFIDAIPGDIIPGIFKALGLDPQQEENRKAKKTRADLGLVLRNNPTFIKFLEAGGKDGYDLIDYIKAEGKVSKTISRIGTPLSGKGIGDSSRDISKSRLLLYDTDIEKIMKPLEKYGFIGVFMADEIKDIPSVMLQKRGSLIMNNEPLYNEKALAKGEKVENPGEHWVALYWDLRHKLDGHYTLHWKSSPHNQGVYYYDSFGRAPSDSTLKNISVLMDRLRKKFNIDYAIYFQYNECRHQDLRSSECGYFACSWLFDMYNDFNPNEKCCPDIGRSELEIKSFEKKVKKQLKE